MREIDALSSGQSESSERGMREFVRAEFANLLCLSQDFRLVEELEVCSGRARVDVAMIGDEFTGIEIKGPKDGVTRLAGQVRAYSQCFDRVVLIVHESLARKAIPLVPEWWGVVVGEQNGDRLIYRVERQPDTNPSVDVEAVLSLLWKIEIETLHADLLGAAPKPKATKKAIRAQLMSSLPLSLLHSHGLRKLRERSDWRNIPVHA